MAAKKKTTRKKIEFDPQKLIEMVNSGISQNEIMKQLGIKTSTQLKVAYANALMEAGKVAQIVGGRGSGKTEPSREVSVGKRGSLIVPKNLVDEFGFKEGDTFIVKRSKAGISLSQTPKK